MTIRTIDDSQRTAAKVAGLTLPFTFALVVYANFAIFDRLMVTGNAAETARNVLAHETLFRIGIACNLVYCLGNIALLAALYILLAPAGRGVALVGALWRLVYTMTWMLMTLGSLDGLRILKRATYLRVFETDRLEALARISLGGGFDRYYAGLPFYALAATACAWLWMKSRYVPLTLAVAGVIASAWCVFCSLAFIIEPHFSDTVNLWWFDTPMALFELALSFWLLFRGLRPPVAGERDTDATGSARPVTSSGNTLHARALAE